MSAVRGNGTSNGRRRDARLAAAQKALSDSRAAASLAIDRTTADLRGLAELARSAALPPARRVDELERAALKHLSDLRESLSAHGTDEEPVLSPVESSSA
jgi:hypothetical protein